MISARLARPLHYYPDETTSRAFPQARYPHPLSLPPDPSTRASDSPRSLASSFFRFAKGNASSEQDVPAVPP
jgi:hypothetical protein